MPDTDADLNPTDESAGGPKALRDALAKANEELRLAREENAKFAKTLRDSTLSSALQAAGANARIAKYIPESVTDAAGVQAWLKDNGEDFGYQPKGGSEQTTQTPTDGPDTSVPDDVRKVFERVQRSEAQGETPQLDADADKFLASLAGAGSFDAAAALLQGR